MTGYFYRAAQFSKRENSTLRPTTTDPTKYTTITFVLKEPTNFDAPVLLLQGGEFQFVYVYIVDWDAYYFIRSKQQVTKDLQQFQLEIDPLATYRSAINSTVGAIEYASTAANTHMVDPRLPVKATKTIKTESGTPGKFSLTGCYIMTVVNDQSATGATTQYCLDAAGFRAVATAMFTNASLVQELSEYFGSAWNAIVNCFWVPFDSGEVPGTTANVYLGKYDTGVSAKKLTDPPVKSSSVTINIPWYYNDFRKSAPYTTIAAWIPGYGYIDINSNDVYILTSLKFEFMLDFSTGDVSVQIVHPVTGGVIYQNMTYNVAAQVMLSNYTLGVSGILSNVGGFLGSAVSTAASAVTQNVGGTIGSAFGMLTNGASAIMAANTRSVSSKGSFTGKALIWEGIDVIINTFSVDTEDPQDATYVALHGRPCGKCAPMSSYFGGYIKCSEASVALENHMTSQSQDIINKFLNEGFYYE